MERLIDDESSKMLKEDFQREMQNVVDVQVYTAKNSEYADFTVQLLTELSALSGKIHLQVEAPETGRTDPTVVIGKNLGYQVVFNGTPAGHEANTIIESIKMISRKQSGLSRSDEEALLRLDKPVNIQVFVTPGCPHCPTSAILATRIAVANPGKVSVEVVEAQENPELSGKFNVSSVPQQVLNGDPETITIGGQQNLPFVRQVIQAGSSNPEASLKEYEEIRAQGAKLSDHPSEPVNITDSNLAEALAKYPNLVVDFWAVWCGPCRLMGPIVDDLAKEYQGKVVFGKLNVDENQSTATEYRVDTIPTLIFYKDGKRVHSIIGVKQKPQMALELTQHFGV